MLQRSIKTRSDGFSLVEMLAVIGLIGALFALAIEGLGGFVEGSRQRDGAAAIVARLREAREVARREGVRVRWVWQPQAELAEGIVAEDQPPRGAHAVFVFRVPAGATRSRLAPIDGSPHHSSSTRIWLPMSLPLPESLVGRWERPDGWAAWQRLPEGLELRGELAELWQRKGTESFARDNFYRPPTTWRLDAWPATDSESARSVYPADYAKIPFPLNPPRLLMPFVSGVLVYDPSVHEVAEAREVWGEAEQEQFVVSESDASRMWALPGVEFRPDGSLAGEWDDRETIRIEVGRSRAKSGARVGILINIHNGAARLE